MNDARILIVEDQNATAKKIEKDLINMGYRVASIVTSGEDVIKKIEGDKPDLVLMDIVLEGKMDGIDVASQIKANFDIPVVYLTAYADEEKLERSKLTEPFGYLIKPFEARELHAAIQTALCKHHFETELKQINKWVFTTLNNIADGVITVDLNERITFINRSAESLIKIKQDDAIGKSLKDIFCVIEEGSEKTIDGLIQLVIKEGANMRMANHVLIANGMKIFIEGDITSIKDDKKGLVGIVLVFRDVTEKRLADERQKQHQMDLEKRIEERTRELLKANKKLEAEVIKRGEIEEHIRRLHRVVEQCTNMVMVTDIDGRIEYVNLAFTNSTGYASDEVIGKNLRILKSGQQSQEVYKEMWETIMAGREWRGEFCNRKKDGAHYWEEAHIFPLKNPEGVVTNFIKVAEDITVRKAMEDELIKSQCELENRVQERTIELSEANEQLSLEVAERRQVEARLEASLKEKDVLMREIHHRVKNNMQIIISLLRLQAKYIEDKRCADIFNECEKRIMSMAYLHEQLYNSKDLSMICSKEYINRLTNELFISYNINPSKIRLDINIEDVFIGIDTAIPCGLIINELVTNAIKYAFPEDKTGEIKIGISSITDDEFEIMISDNGIGIPEEIDLNGAASLGLQLVYSLVTKQLGGRIELNRTKGTGFRIRFPKAF